MKPCSRIARLPWHPRTMSIQVEKTLYIRSQSGGDRYRLALWTRERCQPSSLRVNLDVNDPFRLREVFATQFRSRLDCTFYKFNPRGQRGFRSSQAKLRVVVKPNPNRDNKIWRVANKPPITRRSGLARNRSLLYKPRAVLAVP